MRYYDLFCGIGGFSKGLEPLGFKCMGACEIDDSARKVYSAHFPQVTIDQDATKLERLPRGTQLLCGGFPCQPFSLAGRRLGFEDERGGMFAQILRLASGGRVPYILLENVPGLLSISAGHVFGSILGALDEHGYDVQWYCIDGLGIVPQTRKRLFIVCNLRGYGRPSLLSLAKGDRWDRAPRDKTRPPSILTPEEPSMCLESAYWKGVGYDRPHVLQQLNPGTADAQRVYSAEGPARTQKALSGGQGGKTGLYAVQKTEKAGVFRGKYAVRRLTPLECERLMGFPDGWTLPAKTDTARYKCLGNAVIPGVIKKLGEIIREC